MSNAPGNWFDRGARLRAWTAGLALFALSGLLLQPACDAWSARGEGGGAAGVFAGRGDSAAKADAHPRSGPDECCVIEAMTDHASPLPSVASWHDRSPDAGAAPLPVSAGGILLFAVALASIAYRPPDRRTPYHARSARLLL